MKINRQREGGRERWEGSGKEGNGEYKHALTIMHNKCT